MNIGYPKSWSSSSQKIATSELGYPPFLDKAICCPKNWTRVQTQHCTMEIKGQPHSTLYPFLESVFRRPGGGTVEINETTGHIKSLDWTRYVQKHLYNSVWEQIDNNIIIQPSDYIELVNAFLPPILVHTVFWTFWNSLTSQTFEQSRHHPFVHFCGGVQSRIVVQSTIFTD